NKIKVIYSGIGSKEINFHSSFEKLSEEYSITADNAVFLFVGSGFKRKGVLEFLQIIAKLDKENIKAFVIGREKNPKYYLDVAKNLGIGSKVIFTGPREDVSDFYNISDIFILPTHYEPFSNVVIEALQSENVVFTTKQNGASEILEDKFIMKNPNDFSIVATIEEFLENKMLLKQVKNENRLLSKKFSIEKNLDETLKAINEVIN
ncbi:glycosyltransferase family 4 protein, partial [Candidatus Pseudothioglobus singularis]|nr:glycosyltransferase family 4 protein [Candidatus Pseudothioglobus singularis]